MTSPELSEPSLDADRAPLLRSTVLAWTTSTILVGIGLVVGVAWAWQLFRTQQQASGYGYDGSVDGPGPSIAMRVDLAVSSLGLLAYAGMLVGLGFALRLFADMTAARLGRLADEDPEQAIGPDTV
jgi:hypothetical protein